MKSISSEFIRRTMNTILCTVDNDALYDLYEKKAFEDVSRFREISLACKNAYDGSNGRVVLPFLYNQVGSDRYPYEVVKVYKNDKNIPTMIVVRGMEWNHSYESENSEVTGSKMDGDIVVLKKKRGTNAWYECGKAKSSSYFYECVVPESYYDPTF